MNGFSFKERCMFKSVSPFDSFNCQRLISCSSSISILMNFIFDSRLRFNFWGFMIFEFQNSYSKGLTSKMWTPFRMKNHRSTMSLTMMNWIASNDWFVEHQPVAHLVQLNWFHFESLVPFHVFSFLEAVNGILYGKTADL